MKKLIKNNVNNFNFKNIYSRKTPRFNPIFNNIKLNLKNDSINVRGKYKTFFHEISHNLDYLLEYVSDDKTFEELLKEDFNNVLKKYKKWYNVNDDQAYREISKALSKSTKMSSVSDLIGGITGNKCVGKYKHTEKYWKNKGTLTAEAFAHFGSASIRKDLEELSYIK